MRKALLSSMLAAVIFSGTTVWAAEFTLDKAHSSVNFSIAHMVVARVTGSFDIVDAVVRFDDKDLANSSVTATVQVASVNTKNQQRDDHLRGGDFFEAAKFPVITFTSTKVQHKEGQTYLVTGNMTMKGVTRQVEVPVTIMGPVVNPMSQQPTLGVQARFKINRQDYGVSWNKVLDNGGFMVGNDVDVDVAFELDRPMKQ